MMNTNLVLHSLELHELEALIFAQVRKALELQQPVKHDNEVDEYITIEKAAKILHLAEPTIYGLIHKRSIPYMKRRGRVYFLKSELLEWIKNGRQLTTEELKNSVKDSL